MPDRDLGQPPGHEQPAVPPAVQPDTSWLMAVPLRCPAASFLVTAVALAACPALSASSTRSSLSPPGRLTGLLYSRLRLAREIQLNMWSHFCVRTAALARGTL
jgi:hypothetical protein